MLFATLDPTMRAIDCPGGKRAILSDTVGFISDLPHQLVAAFRATLEEVLDGRSDPARARHRPPRDRDPGRERARDPRRARRRRRGAGRHDRGLEQDRRLPPAEAEALAQVAGARRRGVCAVSALTGQGVPALLAAIEAELAEPVQDETLHLGFDQGRERAWLFDRKLVRAEHATDDGYEVAVRWTDRDRSQYRSL